MEMKKKCYVITVSKNFPSGHIDEGEPTNFVEKILNQEKIHTIRKNFLLWQKRAEEINAGKAYLSLRIWTGRPYHSKQEEFFKIDSIGIEKIDLKLGSSKIHTTRGKVYVDNMKISKRDGLSLFNFLNWFDTKNDPDIKNLVIIHFTSFRYENLYCGFCKTWK